MAMLLGSRANTMLAVTCQWAWIDRPSLPLTVSRRDLSIEILSHAVYIRHCRRRVPNTRIRLVRSPRPVSGRHRVGLSVDCGNITPAKFHRHAAMRPSRPGVLHSEPLTDSGRKPLDLSGSCRPLKAAAFRRDQRVPPVAR